MEDVGVVAGDAAPPEGSDGLFDLHVMGASNTAVAKTGNSFGEDDTDLNAGNDSLLVRFFGRSSANDAGKDDGTIIDCLGVAHAGAAEASSSDGRVSSFFFVALADDGEPELYCKAPSSTGTLYSQPLARGVEKFKIVFGYDGDGDSVPDAWVEAREISAKAAGGGSVGGEWRKVVAVRVGAVARSLRPSGDLKQVSGEDYRLYPLGKGFEKIYFDPPDDGRFRAVATFTVKLRNAARNPA
jgi:type IV pilus assembly protein PilW